eukprot:jgi/Chlat1/3265/Chrsp22S03519
MAGQRVEPVDVCASDVYNALVLNVGEARAKQPLLFDIRGRKEYFKGHIRNAYCVELQGRQLKELAGVPYWSEGCWWDRLVIVYGFEDDDSKPHKHPIVEKLAAEGLVRKLCTLLPVEGYCKFCESYPFLCATSPKPVQPLRFPSEVVEGFLYLGDLEHAQDVDGLKELSITHVLTAHTDKESLKVPKALNHLFINLADFEEEDITSYFDQASDFIDGVKPSSGRVLVHCGAGVSRSATLVVAWLMRCKGWTAEKALEYTKRGRSVVAPNEGFMKALRLYGKKLFAPKSPDVSRLDVMKNDQVVAEIALTSTTINVGRSPDAELKCEHASISRKHAQLLHTPDGWVLQDLESKHGSFVNSKRVPTGKTSAPLLDGAVLTFGASTRRCVLRLSEEDQATLKTSRLQPHAKLDLGDDEFRAQRSRSREREGPTEHRERSRSPRRRHTSNRSPDRHRRRRSPDGRSSRSPDRHRSRQDDAHRRR